MIGATPGVCNQNKKKPVSCVGEKLPPHSLGSYSQVKAVALASLAPPADTAAPGVTAQVNNQPGLISVRVVLVTIGVRSLQFSRHALRRRAKLLRRRLRVARPRPPRPSSRSSGRRAASTPAPPKPPPRGVPRCVQRAACAAVPSAQMYGCNTRWSKSSLVRKSAKDALNSAFLDGGVLLRTHAL